MAKQRDCETADSQPVVRTVGLVKRYRDGVNAVQDLDLTVRRGEIYGFLGPNGAGKTTTLLMLLGIEKPTGGRMELFGRVAPVDPFAVNGRIGVVGERQYLYDDLSAWEYLQLFGRLYQVADVSTRATELLERLGLHEFRRLRARDHSRGMQQKLGLARALLHRPELLVLDEPVSGLDPQGIRQVRELLVEERARGTTILISSHILSEVERTADRVGILCGGRLVAEDTVARIGARLEPGLSIELDVEQFSSGLVDSLRLQPFVTAVDVATNGSPEQALLQVRVIHGPDHRRDISSLVASHGGLIVQMHQRQLSLEDAFVRLTADNAPFPLPLGVPSGELSTGESALRAASPRGRGDSRPRLHAIETLARRELIALLTSLGPYVTMSLGMLVTTVVVRGHLDALVRNNILVVADAFSLPFFVAATLAMLFLALSSAAMVAREREQGTLETLFYGPVDPTTYVLAKHLAHLAVYLPMALLIGLLFTSVAVMTGLHLNGSFALELLLSVATTAAVVALGLLLSTLTRSVRTAFALFAALTTLFLAVRFGSELLSGVRVANNYSPLLFARDGAIWLDRLLGLVSPFTALENGVDAVVRGDPLAYVGALTLSLVHCAVLLAAAVRVLQRRGVRR